MAELYYELYQEYLPGEEKHDKVEEIPESLAPTEPEEHEVFPEKGNQIE